jgi:hypothetical protein
MGGRCNTNEEIGIQVIKNPERKILLNIYEYMCG